MSGTWRAFIRRGLDRRRALVIAARSVAVASAMVLLAGEAAWAICTPPAPAAFGDMVTCTGITSGQNGNVGYGLGSETGVTVTVQNGATVSGADIGVGLDSGTIINSGGITGSSLAGIFMSSGGTVTNNLGGVVS
jgi:hypothetical protein